VSQGQPNGYPAYRLEWQKMGSQLLLDLEAYLAWRGRGLPIESPAVRR